MTNSQFVWVYGDGSFSPPDELDSDWDREVEILRTDFDVLVDLPNLFVGYEDSAIDELLILWRTP